MKYDDILASLILIGASCYGLYALTPTDQPFGYTAAALCLVHGVLMIAQGIEDNEDSNNRPYYVSAGIVDAISLPLANMEFYMQSSLSALTMIHSASIILHVYDVLSGLCESGEGTSETVKDISLLSNVASGAYLGIQEENYFHLGLVATAGVLHFSSHFFGCPLTKFIPHVNTLTRASVIGLMTYSLTNK